MARDPDDITGEIIDSALAIHKQLGSGLLESVYQTVLPRVLVRRGLKVDCERSVSFEFDGMRFERGFTVDLLVEDQVVVELKSKEALALADHKQVLTYLRLMDLRLGLLINFGAATLKQGLHRIVNGYVPTSRSPLAINQLASTEGVSTEEETPS